MYSITDYGLMVASRHRTGAYLQALRRAVGPGSVVLDLGTGTGVFAVMACRMGARRVFAIEADDVIRVAEQVAAANGCADRIRFLRDFSTRVELEEKADVIISDLHGVLPLFQAHIPSIADARRRLLAPGGQLIPRRETIHFAPVEAAETYERFVECCQPPGLEIDMRLARAMAANQWRKAKTAPEQMLAGPQTWAVLDYTRIENPNVGGELTWTLTRPGSLHGLAAWFDAELADGIGFSNAPGIPGAFYGTAFFPMLEPIKAEPGDLVRARVDAVLTGEDYVWRWDTTVHDGTGAQKASFRQSSMLAAPLQAQKLHRRADVYRPALAEDGAADAFILSRMDGSRSVGQIAAEAAERFPRPFSSAQEALKRVADLSERYSR